MPKWEQEDDDFIYSLQFPESHEGLQKGLRRMWRLFRGEEPVDTTVLEKLTEMCFKSGSGDYVGIESRLPSEFADIYPSWLDFHAKYLGNLASSVRILVVKSQAQLLNDKMRNSVNFDDFLRWHQSYKIKLYYVLKETAEEVRKRHDLESTDVALWQRFAIVFKHDKDGVRIHAVLKRRRDEFRKIQKYVTEIKSRVEVIEPEKLKLIAPPLAANWKGYTGSLEERRKLHKFIHGTLDRFENHKGVILDVAAGIGNEVLYLLKNNFTVEINEVDPNFAKILRENIETDLDLRKRGITYDHLHVNRRDWRQLSKSVAPEHINAILALGNDICMVSENGPQERSDCIEEFYKVLCPGGVLIIDERNFPRIIERLRAGEKVSGRSVMYPGKNVECELKLADDSSKIRFDFYVDSKSIGDIDVACLEKNELKNMLKTAGFDPIVVYSDLELKQPPNPDAGFYTYVATKPKKEHGIKREIQAPEKVSDAQIQEEEYIGIGSKGKMEHWGIIGKSDGRFVRFDLDSPHIVCVCGKMGYGKGYTIGVISEMLISKSIPNLSNVPKKATIIVFHNQRDKKSEFYSMKEANNVAEEIKKLKDEYKTDPQKLLSDEDIRVFVDPSTYSDKAEEFRADYGTNNVFPILVDPSAINSKEWITLLSTGSTPEDKSFVDKLFLIIQGTKPFSMDAIRARLTANGTFAANEQKLAEKCLSALGKYVADSKDLDFVSKLALGGVNIFDFRKTMRREEDLFSVMALIMGVLQARKDLQRETADQTLPFVFVINEAHSCFKNGVSQDFVNAIDDLIRRKRHSQNWLLLDTHFPEDLDSKILNLADVKIVHYLSGMASIEALRSDCGQLTNRIAKLDVGQCIVVADETTKGKRKPIMIDIRPRLTKHGGAT